MKKPSKEPSEPTPEMLSAYFSRLGRKGGKARLHTMTAAERSRIAKKAVMAREVRKRGAK